MAFLEQGKVLSFSSLSSRSKLLVAHSFWVLVLGLKVQ